MTVNLSTLIFRVRATVNEISVVQLDDLAVYRELQKAQQFVNEIKKSTVTDTQTEIPLVCLAAYYSHVTYTLLNARQLGTIDETVLIRQNELKRIARAMLYTINAVDITDDLCIDDKRYQIVGGLAFARTLGVMDDRTF